MVRPIQADFEFAPLGIVKAALIRVWPQGFPIRGPYTVTDHRSAAKIRYALKHSRRVAVWVPGALGFGRGHLNRGHIHLKVSRCILESNWLADLHWAGKTAIQQFHRSFGSNYFQGLANARDRQCFCARVRVVTRGRHKTTVRASLGNREKPRRVRVGSVAGGQRRGQAAEGSAGNQRTSC